MTEDEAFIRAIVDNPGDDTPRLVYADWLDDRDDPRGPYLRAEFEWANMKAGGPRSKSFTEKLRIEKQLRRTVTGLDAVWGARLSRPPLGICFFSNSVFEEGTRGPQLSFADIENAETEFGGFPHDYAAFLLNYNGGRLTTSVNVGGFEISGFATINGKFSFREILRCLSDGSEDAERNKIPFAYQFGYTNHHYCHTAMIVRREHGRGRISYPICYYNNPYASKMYDDDLPRCAETTTIG
ncbi:TIGR02996 domain-containing protein [Gemmata sp. G18]|uniref:TIGR02996 domain-containing protein n=1 Tax=Gemmata palustris TaxID=2822762 RepID=A0ABS5C2S5_9BACT|nr:TIGR02996 domain-containing protein [Gemmata palustris]MBP3960251.1 TIGR02996 domain-containing protein [Gemmata palustris]